MNAMKMLQLKPQIQKFQKRHPKFVQFFSAYAMTAAQEGSVLEITITDPDGKVVCTNMKVTADDVQLVHDLSEALQNN